MDRLHNVRIAIVCLVSLAGLGQGCSESPATEISAASSDLRVRRADFQTWHLLTARVPQLVRLWRQPSRAPAPRSGASAARKANGPKSRARPL